MKGQITATSVKQLKPQSSPFELLDRDLKGFLARIQPSGVITYYYSYRALNGTRRRYWIGKHPGITAPAARKAAELAAAKVIQGIDPQGERKIARATKRKERFETLGGFIEHKYESWALAHQRRGKETISLLKANFEHLYSRKLVDVTPWDVQKWRTEKTKKGLSPSSMNRRVTPLKSVLNKAVEWGVIQINPLINVKPIKIDSNSRVRYLSDDEEDRLRAALGAREQDIRSSRDSGNAWREKRGYLTKPYLEDGFADYLKPMIILCLNTGMRRGEVFNLTWRDVDLERKQIIIEGQTAKSGQTRYLPLNSEAFAVLQKWRVQSVSHLVFASPVTGGRFDNVKRSWEALRHQAGLNDFRFHDLRHTFASKLVMAGIDLYTVKELMGHSTIQMTERYAHLAPEHKATAVESISALRVKNSQ